MAESTARLSDHDLSVALHRVGEPSSGGMPSLPQARLLLEAVHETAAATLETYLDAVHHGSLRLVADRRDLIVFADPDRRIISDLLRSCEEYTDLNEQIVRAVMVHMAGEVSDRAWESVDPVVVTKPEDWQRGEDGVERLITWLLTVGLTPEEALDFWGTVLRGNSQSAWASIRDVSESVVTENVTAAREKLGAR